MNQKPPFVGRIKELNSLAKLLKKKNASLVVITGRRRIGKSRLIEEFANQNSKYDFFRFSGLALTKEMTAQDQREEFARNLSKNFKLPKLKADDWGDLLDTLAEQCKKRKAIILLDEISWMGSKDQTFLPKLKNTWDLYFSKNSSLVLVLCGSVSSWIEKNIISSTGFFGRVDTQIRLEELSILECGKYFKQVGFKVSNYEKLTYLNLTGGVPWYLELLNPKYSSLENIRTLCFAKDGTLVEEFDRIFHDLFDKRGEVCKKIIRSLVKATISYEELSKKINYSASGSLANHVNELITAGFIERNFTWQIKNKKISKLSTLRLKDNYLRFYFRFIEPNLSKIHQGLFEDINISSLPGWASIQGLQFENLVLNNRKLIIHELKIEPENIVFDGPFYQTPTANQTGCQIDYLIQSKYNTLYLCEIKFSPNQIKTNVINEVAMKIKNLKTSNGFSVSPVLIHANGIEDNIDDSEYFRSIIDFSSFLG